MLGERIQAEQGDNFDELMLIHPRYYSEPMVLGDYWHIAGNFEALGRDIQDLIINQQSLLDIIVGLLGNESDHIRPVRRGWRLPIGCQYREASPERARQDHQEQGR